MWKFCRTYIDKKFKTSLPRPPLPAHGPANTRLGPTKCMQQIPATFRQNSTQVHCTKEHSGTLHKRTLRYTAQMSTQVHGTKQHSGTLHKTALRYTAQNSTQVHCTKEHSGTLHETALRYTAQKSTQVHCTKQHSGTLHKNTKTVTIMDDKLPRKLNCVYC
jgi:hypothetical protein